MNPRVTSIENLIASDPGGRNIFGLVIADQLRLAAQSLRLAKRVGIVSGFYIPQANAGETDGPPGAKALGDALAALEIEVDYITDRFNAPLFRALGIEPLVEPTDYLTRTSPTHLVSIERAARAHDGRYRNMRGADITDTTASLDEWFIQAARLGLTTVGIGDGGNEIGMGKVFADALATIPHGPQIASIIAADFCIAAGVSNWGAFGLVGALSILVGRDLLPTVAECESTLRRLVEVGGAVDGVTHLREPTVDGLELSVSIRMLESIRRQIVPSPLDRGEPLRVGVLGYGQTGRAVAALLSRHGHHLRISDTQSVTVEEGLSIEGVESAGHTIDFLTDCNLVVASPGIREDAPIRDELHRRGIPIASELEVAFRFCKSDIIAVTGTVGKRTTIELLQRFFDAAGRQLSIGGNRGRPLSALLLDQELSNPIALAVSSFQLENVITFRPRMAVILNIDDAHLDRHRSIPEYIRTKSRIFMNHRPDDILILPFDDDRLRPLARKHQGRTFFISPTQPVERGAWLQGDSMVLNVDGTDERVMPDPFRRPCPFPENLLATALATRLSLRSIPRWNS